jgi:hypothetical protein
VRLRLAAGWTRTGDHDFTVELPSWTDARDPLGTVIAAAMLPFSDLIGPLYMSPRDRALRQDRARRMRLSRALLSALVPTAARTR